MTSLEADMETLRTSAAPASAGPGASLKAARERAGLSLDAAAQALKLAPRQVKALEDEDFGQLPGRTFARGFVRNYARLLNLDGEALLAQLPDASHAPALAAPSLHSTGTTMGEVPATRVARPAFRSLIPIVLVALVIAAGGYEWYRNRAAPAKRVEPTPAAVAPTAPTAGTARTELANPLSSSAEPPAPESRAPLTGASPMQPSEPSTEGAGAGAPAISPPSPPATPAVDTPAVTATAPASPAAAAAASPATSAAAIADAPLVISYRAAAWTQVRDSRGQLLLNRIVPAGSEQPISGTPPFDITIGNARAVTMVYRGQPIDLARYTRQNIARLHLQ